MENEKRLTLIEHLDELRKRIINCLLAVLVTSGISYIKVKDILHFLIKPLKHAVFISPMEVFVVYIKVALFCGMVLASPIILFQIWQFVVVALTKSEKKYVALMLPPSLLFFLMGGAFAYFVIIPFSIKFLLSFSTEYLTPMISVNSYISFIGILILATGMVFELPIVILFLNAIGIVSPKALRRNYKFVIVFIFIIAAVITPTPDIFTQILVAVPMLLLYEISIWLCHISNSLRKK
jgi:sec-independent protein translocase protein TatC